MSIFSQEKYSDAIEFLLQHCHKRRYSPKTTLIAAGDSSDELFYLVKGSVSVLIEDDDGHEIVLSYLNKGDFFGELGMFDEDKKRSAWVRSRTECEVASIKYTELMKIAEKLPWVLHAIMKQLADRLRKTSRKVGDLAFMDVSGRVARTLLDLCKEPDAMTHPDGMQLKISRQELGKIVGCSREMVGRVLKNLEEQALIDVKGQTIVVFGTR